MMGRSLLRWRFIIALAPLFAGCAMPVVKGNIYRTGFKEGKLPQLIERFHKGSFAIFPFKGIFENRMMGVATDGNAVSDLISIQMLYQGYKVLERDKMQKILEEKAFKASGLVEPPPAPPAGDSGQVKPVVAAPKPETGIDIYKKPPETTEEYMEIGKMLGVDFLVTGSIIQYEYQLAKSSFNGGEISLAVTITSRIIDVRNGDIVFAMSAGTSGNNLPEALDRITMAFTDALKEGKVYVWE